MVFLVLNKFLDLTQNSTLLTSKVEIFSKVKSIESYRYIDTYSAITSVRLI